MSDRRIDGGSFNQAASSEMSMQGTRHTVVQVDSTNDLIGQRHFGEKRSEILPR